MSPGLKMPEFPLVKTHSKDVPVLLFHPGQKLCSIFSKSKSVTQPWNQAFVQWWLIGPSVQVYR